MLQIQCDRQARIINAYGDANDRICRLRGKLLADTLSVAQQQCVELDGLAVGVRVFQSGVDAVLAALATNVVESFVVCFVFLATGYGDVVQEVLRMLADHRLGTWSSPHLT